MPAACTMPLGAPDVFNGDCAAASVTPRRSYFVGTATPRGRQRIQQVDVETPQDTVPGPPVSATRPQHFDGHHEATSRRHDTTDSWGHEDMPW